MSVPPHRILAVTFTTKAAREMKERVNAQIPKSQQTVHIGTLHHVSYDILQRHFSAKRQKRPIICDTLDQRTMIHSIAQSMNVAEHSVDILLASISQLKNSMWKDAATVCLDELCPKDSPQQRSWFTDVVIPVMRECTHVVLKIPINIHT